MDAKSIAKALHGRRTGSGWSALCPAHDDRHPSLSISDGSDRKVLVHCHAGCDQAQVIDALGIRGLWAKQGRRSISRPGRRRFSTDRKPAGDDAGYAAAARAIWAASTPASGTAVENYLKSRGLHVPPPPSIRFLTATRNFPPAMVAALSIAQESEPGILTILPNAVRAVQLTSLAPDGMGKAKGSACKRIIGRGASGIPVALAAPTDLLGLAITEGIEDALSIHAATGMGAWAACGAGRLEALAPTVPTYIEYVAIYADDDKAGMEGAVALHRRLTDRGIFAKIKVLNLGMEAARG